MNYDFSEIWFLWIEICSAWEHEIKHVGAQYKPMVSFKKVKYLESNIYKK